LGDGTGIWAYRRGSRRDAEQGVFLRLVGVWGVGWRGSLALRASFRQGCTKLLDGFGGQLVLKRGEEWFGVLTGNGGLQ